jgi:hypothetical protein
MLGAGMLGARLGGGMLGAGLGDQIGGNQGVAGPPPRVAESKSPVPSAEPAPGCLG